MAKKVNKVKRTKGNLNLLIIVFLAVGWLCALKVAFTDKEAEEQDALIKQAEVFLEDKLYIRAVNNYELAISAYQTDRNPELETQLLGIYKEAGMMQDYYGLVTDRIDKQVATEEEYVALAKSYISANSMANALQVLNKGLALFDNEEMTQLKESVKYECKVKSIDMPTVKPLTGSALIPAFNGEKWGYVADNGKTALNFIYDEAIPFSGDYAVVKLDGVYTLIDQSGYWNAVDKNDLDEVTDISSVAVVGAKNGKYKIYSRTFVPLSDEEYEMVYLNDNGLYVVKKDGKWAILSDALEPIVDFELLDVAVNSKGRVFDGDLAMVKDEGGYFLITSSGEELFEARFPQAKGFEGGLCAVANGQNKWGFVDGYGELLIECQYTDAHSFSDDLAAVKYAGKWGYINRYNEMKIDAEYEEAYPFVSGKGLVKTELGGYKVLNLKLYEYFE